MPPARCDRAGCDRRRLLAGESLVLSDDDAALFAGLMDDVAPLPDCCEAGGGDGHQQQGLLDFSHGQAPSVLLMQGIIDATV